MHKCHISSESGWNYINMFFVCIEAEETVWVGCAFVPAAFWILVLILSLADQAGQDLETTTSFFLSVFSALYKKSNISFPCLNALRGPSSAPCRVQLLH